MRPYHEVMRELREGRDLTQADLALVLDTRQQAYSRYENGVNELPIRHLITLCGFYHVSADYLLGLSDQK
ncbi:MAG: helix-turn-helix transcriptional regulator [Clostridia bacterium]